MLFMPKETSAARPFVEMTHQQRLYEAFEINRVPFMNDCGHSRYDLNVFWTSINFCQVRRWLVLVKKRAFAFFAEKRRALLFSVASARKRFKGTRCCSITHTATR